MPAGRPSKYDPSMCGDVISLMREGASKTEVAAELGINKTTLYEWDKTYPEFSDALKEGEALSEAWWLKMGRKHLQNKDFNYVGWYMNMKNRHGWKDKQDITSNDETISFQVKNA